jgi:hypothetical protein
MLLVRRIATYIVHAGLASLPLSLCLPASAQISVSVAYCRSLQPSMSTNTPPQGPYSGSTAFAAYGSTQAGDATLSSNGYSNATIWTGTASTAYSLQPSTGYTDSTISAMTATQEGGNGSSSSSGTPNALIWTGTNSTPMNLNPTLGGSPAFESFVTGMSAASGPTPAQAVGFALDSNYQDHAMLWNANSNGTAYTAVDLNGVLLNNATANAVSGGYQAGTGEGPGTGGAYHAMVWQGTSTFEDLDTGGTLLSQANGISGNLVVGYESILNINGVAVNHAYAWQLGTGSSFTATDLLTSMGSGYSDTQANAVAGSYIVGYANGSATGDEKHAVVWLGTSGQFLDLAASLPTTHAYTSSEAYGVTSSGYIVGEASYTSGSNTIENAIVWKVMTPAPPACPIAAVGFLLTLSRARRRLGSRRRRAGI